MEKHFSCVIGISDFICSADIIVAVVLSWAAVCGSETAEPSPALMLDRAPSLLWNLWREEVAFTHQVCMCVYVCGCAKAIDACVCVCVFVQGSHLVGFSRKHLLIYDLDLGRTVRCVWCELQLKLCGIISYLMNKIQFTACCYRDDQHLLVTF